MTVYEIMFTEGDVQHVAKIDSEDQIMTCICQAIAAGKATANTEFTLVKIIREPAQKIKLGIQSHAALADSLPEEQEESESEEIVATDGTVTKRKRRTRAEMVELRRKQAEERDAKAKARENEPAMGIAPPSRNTPIPEEPIVKATESDIQNPTKILEEEPVDDLAALDAAIAANENYDTSDALKDIV